MLKRKQIPREFRCRSQQAEVSNSDLRPGICIFKSNELLLWQHNHYLTTFNKEKKATSHLHIHRAHSRLLQVLIFG